MRTFFTIGLTGMLALGMTGIAMDLGPQIHAISDETHHQIEALLTKHQKQLAKTMQERMRNGEESRRTAPSR